MSTCPLKVLAIVQQAVGGGFMCCPSLFRRRDSH